MSLDKFGRASHSSDNNSITRRLISPPITFTLDGNIDCENRRLCNVKDPRSDLDSVNKKYIDEKINSNFQQIEDYFIITYNNYTKTMSTSWDIHMEQYKSKMDEMNRKYNDCIKTTSNIQNDLKKTQDQIIQYFEELQRFNKTITTLDEKLTATDSLTKNVERELNQFENTIIPQISELSLMITNGDRAIKKEFDVKIARLKQDINNLKKKLHL